LDVSDQTVLGGLLLAEATELLSVNLSSVEFVGPLNVFRNDKLTSFVSESLVRSRAYNIYENNAITYISAPKLTSVLNNVYIQSSPHLTYIGLNASLSEIPIDLVVTGNTELPALHLSALSSVGRQAQIEDCAALSMLSLPALRSVGGHLTLQRLNVSQLQLGSLVTVGGQCIVSSNAALATVSMPNLVSVGSDLIISLCAVLAEVSATSLQSVGASLQMYDTNVTAIELPELRTVGGSVSVYHNAFLTSMVMDALTSVGGTLSIRSNVALTDVSFKMLASVGGIDFSYNGNVGILALNNLATVAGSMVVNGEGKLTLIDAGKLNSVHGPTISICDNASLMGKSMPAVLNATVVSSLCTCGSCSCSSC
jgi:hypothetical protein